ncbi:MULTISPECIES: DoxX family protein [unclassified Amycolatopsis]|uniref:DoxX family protein n=1 Tax=unclassified Amycolatopsis TaxID=2618356 RepID=UPI002E0F6AF1|nr:MULTISPECIES: DoxX family protein [unclassified Amycolatopsis]WSJ79724.1 DoxX family protein [Amycolatopsis sp. NBC_01307]WSK76782.1 DoxX family protein [Amycolatopsis sp. NBC_01286]
MNVVLWIAAGLLAVLYLGAGGMKLATPREKLLENPNMGWTADFSAAAIKGIGAIEIVGAIGLILPWALDIAPVLTPLAATGLAIVQIGAIIVHARRKETKALPMNVVLLVLAAFVAVGRFAG